MGAKEPQPCPPEPGPQPPPAPPRVLLGSTGGVAWEGRAVVLVPVSPATAVAEVAHLDLRLQTQQQREIMGRVAHALNRSHAQTADGRHVDTAAAAVRWLLESIAESSEVE